MPKILTVDDSLFTTHLIKKILNDAGYKEVIESNNAEEGIEIYKKEKPDLVLMDVIMGNEMGGLEALRQIMKFDPNAKIIMVTVVGQKLIAKEAVAMGAIDYMLKPFEEMKLLQKVKQHLG